MSSKSTNQPWLEAARAFNAMDQESRTAYWSGLSPEQKRSLELALKQDSSRRGTRSGCIKNTAIGCGGMIVGIVFTIVFEVWAVSQGIEAFSDLLNSGPESAIFGTEDPYAWCKDPDAYMMASPDEKAHCAAAAFGKD